jgi:hypothetical protein
MEIDVGHTKGSIAIHQRYATNADSMHYKFDYLKRNHYNGDTYLVRNFLGVMQGIEKPFSTLESAIAAEKTGLAAVRSVKSRQLEAIEQIKITDSKKYK